MHSTEILVPLGFFAMVLAIVYLSIRKKERMALIEKGADASAFVTKSTGNNAMKWGLLLVGLGLGLLVGSWLSKTAAFHGQEDVAHFAMLFLFGGIALVISYFIGKRDEEKGNDKPKSF